MEMRFLPKEGWLWALSLALTLLVAGAAVNFGRTVPLHLDASGRQRGLMHRIECELETQGIIRADPFRHVVG